jgi:hypothetical protein
VIRFAIVFISCLFIFGCSSKDAVQAEFVSQVVALGPTPQQTLSTEPELECHNVTGILGFADIGFDDKTVLYFYDNPDASQTPAQILRFYNDTTIKRYSFLAEREKSYPTLRPEVHKLDYGIFDLAVVNRRNGWLEVIVGEQKNETLWLKESKFVRFKDWLQDMKEAFSVGRVKSTVNPLRAKPDATAKEVDFKGRDCFKVKKMKGDWIKVTMQDNCGDAPKQHVSGWIRWRDEKGCLMVEIFPIA